LYSYPHIANTLISEGFDLRRHGGDFFIRKDGRFVCFLSFQPMEGKVYVETMHWNPQASQAVRDIVCLLMDTGISISFEFPDSGLSV
jgi:hypothetical protein